MSEAQRFWFVQAEGSLFDTTGAASVAAIGMALLLRGSLFRQLPAATLKFLTSVTARTHVRERQSPWNNVTTDRKKQ